MRKLLFLIVALSSLWQVKVSAQDTVEYLDPRYMFNRRVQRTTPNTQAVGYIINPQRYWNLLNCDTVPLSYSGSTMHCYFTKDTVTVYGVAIPMTETDSMTLINTHFQATMANRPGGIFAFIDTVEWEHGTVEHFRYTIWGEGVLYDSVVPCYEFYFDNPHIVSDSFFVGYYNRLGYNINYNNVMGYYSRDSIPTTYVLKDPRPNPWGYVIQGMVNVWGRFFPILQPCRTPEAPRVTAMHDTIRLAWDEQPDSVQLALIPLSQTGGDSIYNVTDTVLYINGLQDGIYLASIRTKCTRNMYWSLWSDSTSITVNTLSVSAAPAPEVTLAPNPTGSTMTIRCAAEMTKVELYDMQGRQISDQWSMVNGQNEAVLDLSALPKGTYVLLAHTAKGQVSRTMEKR